MSTTTTVAVAAKKEPRLVQIGLNLISLLDVNDIEHSFEGNVLMHVFWDARPMVQGARFFRPWIQLHNIKAVDNIENAGMTQWTDKELAEKVATEMKKNQEKGKPDAPVNVMESVNFVGRFVSTLDLRDFPFDQQDLRITVMSNTTSDVTFSHKVGRNPVTREAEPLRDKERNRVICAIKCNLEADTLSEWDVLLQDEHKQGSDLAVGEPSPAVVSYAFMEHDKAFSAEGQIYQRMDFHVYVKRELKNMVVTILLPTSMLSASALCAYSLDIMDDRGERFGVLFTVVLTIVANQFVTQGRLPYLAYFTWLDQFMLLMQFFVYAIIVQTAVCERIATNTGRSPHEVDEQAMYIMFGLFGCLAVYLTGSGIYRYHKRQVKMREAREHGRWSYLNEENRLRKLWGMPLLNAEEFFALETPKESPDETAKETSKETLNKVNNDSDLAVNVKS